MNQACPGLVIVGPFPAPTGGVSNFVLRLASQLRALQPDVVDLYPANGKWAVPGVTHDVLPASANRALWLRERVASKGDARVYFNFSTERGVLTALACKKSAGSTWYLTLHHGVLPANGKGSRLAKVQSALVRIALSRFDHIGYLSEPQRQYYVSIGISEERLSPITSYLVYPQHAICPKEERAEIEELEPLIQYLRNCGKTVVIASGYPTALYRHDWVADLASHAVIGDRLEVVLCIYGPRNEDIRLGLRHKLSTGKNLHILEDRGPAVFRALLAVSNIYARPTEVDSLGVAVHEALDLGKVVIASDACARDPRCFVFRKEDRAGFESLVNGYLDDTISRELGARNSFVTASKSLVLPISDFLKLPKGAKN